MRGADRAVPVPDEPVRSFRSLVSPKSGRPYGLIAAAILLVIGFVFIPVVTGVVLAYGYLLAPVLIPLVSPLGRLVPVLYLLVKPAPA